MTNSVKKNSLIRKWIKDNGNDGFVSFDFKKKNVLFLSPLATFETKVRTQRRRRRAMFQEDIKSDTPACSFWFGSLDETIQYLQNTRIFLKKLGYDTSQSIDKRFINKEDLY